MISGKNRTFPRVGHMGKPFAEQTKMGWFITLPVSDNDIVSILFTKTPVNEYEKLCDTDVLGIKEFYYKHYDYVCEKFQKGLKRDEEGWYEVSLVRRKSTFR